MHKPIAVFFILLCGCHHPEGPVMDGGGAVQITTGSALPDGTQGIAYGVTLALTGGASPYAWRVSSGALPAGLTLDSAAGAISGTPTVVSTASFTLQVTDATSATATQAFTLRVKPLTKLGVNESPAFAYNDLNTNGWVWLNNSWYNTLDRIDYTVTEMAKYGVQWWRDNQPFPENIPTLAHSLVSSGGNYYECILAHTSTLANAPPNATHWHEITRPPDGHYGDWVSGRNYVKSDGSTPIVFSDADGWVALDKEVALARSHGIKLILGINHPYWSVYTYTTVDNYKNNWAKPLAGYLARRYKRDTDIISIDPGNEYNGDFIVYFTDASNPVGPPYAIDPRWMDYQREMYDTVKANAPEMRVHLVSINEWDSASPSQTLNMIDQLCGRDIGYGAGCILPGCAPDALGQKYWMEKFDDFIDYHMYPEPRKITAPDFYNSVAIPAGAGRYADSATYVAKARGCAIKPRNDVQAFVGEFGIFWYGAGTVTVTHGSTTIAGDANANFFADFRSGDSVRVYGDAQSYTIQSVVSNASITLTSAYGGPTRSYRVLLSGNREQLSADAMEWVYNAMKTDANVGGALYWRFYGADKQIQESSTVWNYTNSLGQQGMGLFKFDTEVSTIPGRKFQQLTLQ